MSARHRVPVLIGATAAAVALLLGGCASSGTVNSKSTTGGVIGGPTGGPSTPAASDSSSSPADNPTSTDTPSSDSSDSAIAGQLKALAGAMTDPGCKQTVNALGDVLSMENDPLKLAGSLPQVIQKIRQGAATTQKPGAKDAINKLADDLQAMFDTAVKGGTPDTASIGTDSAAFATACIG